MNRTVFVIALNATLVASAGVFAAPAVQPATP